jgi:flagellar basal body-associated protein FliL
MAEEKHDKKEQPENNEKNLGIISILIIAAVLLVFIISGFVIGKKMGGGNIADPNQRVKFKSEGKIDSNKPDKTEKQADGESWYYELDPVLANLNSPGATRYVRAVLVLQMSPEISKNDGEKLLEKKKPILVNWLTIYLSNLSLEQATGEENIQRIRANVLDAFNEKLWPDSKPKIEKILLKEFPIQ